MKHNCKARFLALCGFCLAVVAGADAYLQLGWRSAVDVQLVSQSGNAAALRGFTLRGKVGNGSYTTAFDLHDGYLDTSFDPEDITGFWAQSTNYADTYYAVMPSARTLIEADAVLTNSDSISTSYNVQTNQLREMLKINLTDGTTLQVAIADRTLPEPVNLSAYYTPSYAQDYICYGYENDSEDFTTLRTISSQPFFIGTANGLCWVSPVGSYKPGLYRATGLTYSAIEALPATVHIGQREAVSAATEYGTLEEFYCPDDAVQGYLGANMVDGSLLFLYANTSKMLCADLVNAAGVRTDHLELEQLSAPDAVAASLYTRTSNQSAMLYYIEYEDSSMLQFRQDGTLALCAEHGKFTFHKVVDGLPGTATNQTVLLNDARDALLIAQPYTVTERLSNTKITLPLGTEISVQSLADGKELYRGVLEYGAQLDWASVLPIKVSSTQATRGLIFDRMPQDRGDTE